MTSQCAVVASSRLTLARLAENLHAGSAPRVMAREKNAARALHHVTSVVLHVANAAMTALLHAMAVVTSVVMVLLHVMTVVLHVASAAMTVLLHAMDAVTSVALHVPSVMMAASSPARVVPKAANHLTARVTASARHLIRAISSHCVVVRARETMINQKKENKYVL